MTDTTSFRLSCSGPGGGISRRVTLHVVDGPLSVDLAVSRERIASGERVKISWSAEGATECRASGGWKGKRNVAGSFRTAALTQDTSFQLRCGNGTDNELASVRVAVHDKSLKWRAPTHNVDGSPLKDLAGYVVYWGKESRKYTGSKRIHSPNTTEWVPDVPAGEYLFALTAFDRRGNESDYSNEIEKFIP